MLIYVNILFIISLIISGFVYTFCISILPFVNFIFNYNRIYSPSFNFRRVLINIDSKYISLKVFNIHLYGGNF